ncbi:MULTISPECIES: hypothetical protein [unclassified Streptomyces]|uniref:hypothetical protein n=1 Tax=unclassified Streptomyces TaxID=2593676 RepID=UPI002E3031A3|nr:MULTISPECIES: hypothetical protein [unclassified Streptomyces]WUC65225.1 hypothetical protein OG861_13755 [Streptomyces sp. NBC_00539]
MIRNLLGSLLGLIGAAAAVWSPFRAWYGGRHGRDYRLADLFSTGGITDAKAALFASLLLPFCFAALLALVAIVRCSRALMALAGVVVLGIAVLWMVRQGQAVDGIAVGTDGKGIGEGVASAFGAGALLILAGAVMRGRSRRRVRDRDLPPTFPASSPHPAEPWPPPPAPTNPGFHPPAERP